MSRSTAMLLAVIALVLTAARPASGVPQGPEKWDTFVDQRREATGTPGLAYAVVSPEGIEHAREFGTDGNGEVVDAESVFLWGSVSKPVAAMLVFGLMQDGLLGLDDTVAEHLPGFRVQDARATSSITIRELLNHTSGLPPALYFTDRDDPQRRPIDAVREMHDLALFDPPGRVHHYSSVNYLVLAAVVEEVTGHSYADVLTERVLGPLDMSRVVTTSAEAKRRLPPGHRYVAGSSVAFDSPYDPAGLAYGYLGGTVGDLARFARAQLGGNPTVISDSDRSAMRASKTKTGSGGTYGLGWRQSRLTDFDVDSDTPIVWHSGAAPGYQSSIILLPDHQRAVVMLQNSYGFFQEDALLHTSMGLAALLDGTEPPPTRGSGWIYPGILIGLALIAAMLVIVSTRSLVRLVRPATPRGARQIKLHLVGWIVLTGALAYTLGIVVPGVAGVSMGQLTLWTPDVGWLTTAGALLAIVVLLLQVAVAGSELWSGQRDLAPG